MVVTGLVEQNSKIFLVFLAKTSPRAHWEVKLCANPIAGLRCLMGDLHPFQKTVSAKLWLLEQGRGDRMLVTGQTLTSQESPSYTVTEETGAPRRS